MGFKRSLAVVVLSLYGFAAPAQSIVEMPPESVCPVREEIAVDPLKAAEQGFKTAGVAIAGVVPAATGLIVFWAQKDKMAELDHRKKIYQMVRDYNTSLGTREVTRKALANAENNIKTFVEEFADLKHYDELRRTKTSVTVETLFPKLDFQNDPKLAKLVGSNVNPNERARVEAAARKFLAEKLGHFNNEKNLALAEYTRAGKRHVSNLEKLRKLAHSGPPVIPQHLDTPEGLAKFRDSKAAYQHRFEQVNADIARRARNLKASIGAGGVVGAFLGFVVYVTSEKLAKAFVELQSSPDGQMTKDQADAFDQYMSCASKALDLNEAYLTANVPVTMRFRGQEIDPVEENPGKAADETR